MSVKPLKRRANHPGETILPSGRKVWRTQAGIDIGLRYSPPPKDVGTNAERIQEILLSGRPLAFDQIFAAALCVPSRRP